MAFTTLVATRVAVVAAASLFLPLQEQDGKKLYQALMSAGEEIDKLSWLVADAAADVTGFRIRQRSHRPASNLIFRDHQSLAESACEFP